MVLLINLIMSLAPRVSHPLVYLALLEEQPFPLLVERNQTLSHPVINRRRSRMLRLMSVNAKPEVRCFVAIFKVLDIEFFSGVNIKQIGDFHCFLLF